MAPHQHDSSEPVEVKLARIETKVDLLLTGNTDHEKRIRSLERGQWTFAGIATVLGALLPALAHRMGIDV